MSLQIFGKISGKLEKAIIPELITRSRYHYRETPFANLTERKFAWLDLRRGHRFFAERMNAGQDEMLAKTWFASSIDMDLPAMETHEGISTRVCAELKATSR